MMNDRVGQDLRDLSTAAAKPFDGNTCFLCSCSLFTSKHTSEHIIPEWVQRRFDLWNQSIYLSNNTWIAYRFLTIPCCEDCNKYRLGPIETLLAQATLAGFNDVQSLGSKILYLWLSKIFYGILCKESLLSTYRSFSNGERIIPREMLQRFSTLRFFLQEARNKIEAVDFFPGSIFLFKTQVPQDQRAQWDFCDHIDGLFIGCRIGEVGMIGVLLDGGAQQAFEEDFADFKDFPLHPMQFRELCAVCAYKASLATRYPKYITMAGKPHQVYQMPLGGWSVRPLFNEWDDRNYAYYLSHYTGLPFEDIYKPPDKVWSCIYDNKGKFRCLDFRSYPFLPFEKRSSSRIVIP